MAMNNLSNKDWKEIKMELEWEKLKEETRNDLEELWADCKRIGLFIMVYAIVTCVGSLISEYAINNQYIKLLFPAVVVTIAYGVWEGVDRVVLK